MIVTADLHLTEESEDIVFDEVLPGLVERARAISGEEDGPATIAILGDIYHVRYKVSVRLQNRLYNVLNDPNGGLYWILMPGNHDQINPAGEHALEVFKDLDNVQVKSEPGWDEYGLWVPYRKNTEDIQRALIQPKPESSPAIAWMHHGVQGAYMNNQLRDRHGIPVESFNEFERVFCGHYHLPQDIGNLSYIGSPYQTRADEAGQQKRVGVWDPATRTMDWSPENWGRRFFRIEAGPDGAELPAEATPADELRIQAQSGVDPEALAKSLADRGFTKVVVTPAQRVTAARLQVEPGKGLAAYAEEYVKQFGGELDRGKLMDIWREVAS